MLLVTARNGASVPHFDSSWDFSSELIGTFQTVSLKLSEKSRMRLQRSLTGHRNSTFSAHSGVRIPAKSTVEALLLPLFGQSLEKLSEKGVLGSGS